MIIVDDVALNFNTISKETPGQQRNDDAHSVNGRNSVQYNEEYHDEFDRD